MFDSTVCYWIIKPVAAWHAITIELRPPGLPVAVFGDESRLQLNEESWDMRLTIPLLSPDSLGITTNTVEQGLTIPLLSPDSLGNS